MPAVAEPTRTGGWWGDGPPPSERWPGVTIPIDDCGGRYRFDAAAADKVCAFFPKFCSHSKGATFAGQAFTLLDYQTHLLLRPLFGWVRVEDGLRRFQKAYIELPKKNGKTQLIAGLALYMLLCDNEPGAEVYVAAGDREQARILFDAAKAMVEGPYAHPSLSRRLVVYRNRIVRADDPAAFFQVLSSEAATKHGPNIHCLIIDELHAQPDRDLFETLTRGIISRRQPLILEITTAGDDDESICFEEYEYAKSILTGTVQDERFLPVVFEATADEDWTVPALWERVNPGLGITISRDTFEGFAVAAMNEPRKRNDFLRYHLNRWVNQATAWLPVEWWDACDEPMPSDEELRAYPCALGIDMSQKIDLTCVSTVFQMPLKARERDDTTIETVNETDDGEIVRTMHKLNYRIAILPAFWLPEDTLLERVKQDGIRYDIYRDQKLLNVTEGTIIDFEAMVRHIKHPDKRTEPRDLATRFPLVKQADIGYDPAFATELAIQLRDHCGFKDKTVEVLQNYKHLSEACQVFEALVKAKRVIHGGHRLLRWNLENVAIKTDDAGRIRPVKSRKATKRIDGIVATIIALSRLMAMPEPRIGRGRARVWTPDGFKDVSPNAAPAS